MLINLYTATFGRGLKIIKQGWMGLMLNFVFSPKKIKSSNCISTMCYQRMKSKGHLVHRFPFDSPFALTIDHGAFERPSTCTRLEVCLYTRRSARNGPSTAFRVCHSIRRGGEEFRSVSVQIEIKGAKKKLTLRRRSKPNKERPAGLLPLSSVSAPFPSLVSH